MQSNSLSLAITKPGDAKLKINSKRTEKMSWMDTLRFRLCPEVILV